MRSVCGNVRSSQSCSVSSPSPPSPPPSPIPDRRLLPTQPHPYSNNVCVSESSVWRAMPGSHSPFHSPSPPFSPPSMPGDSEAPSLPRGWVAAWPVMSSFHSFPPSDKVTVTVGDVTVWRDILRYYCLSSQVQLPLPLSLSLTSQPSLLPSLSSTPPPLHTHTHYLPPHTTCLPLAFSPKHCLCCACIR